MFVLYPSAQIGCILLVGSFQKTIGGFHASHSFSAALLLGEPFEHVNYSVALSGGPGMRVYLIL